MICSQFMCYNQRGTVKQKLHIFDTLLLWLDLEDVPELKKVLQ